MSSITKKSEVDYTSLSPSTPTLTTTSNKRKPVYILVLILCLLSLSYHLNLLSSIKLPTFHSHHQHQHQHPKHHEHHHHHNCHSHNKGLTTKQALISSQCPKQFPALNTRNQTFNPKDDVNYMKSSIEKFKGAIRIVSNFIRCVSLLVIRRRIERRKSGGEKAIRNGLALFN